MSSYWVYRKRDGQFLRGGWYVPACDAETEGVLEIDDDADPHPSIERERFDAAAPTGRRRLNAEELTATQARAREAQIIDAMQTGEAMISAAAANMAILFPSLAPPNRENQRRFVEAVNASAKELLVDREVNQ